MHPWLARDDEMEFFRRELDSFVPERIFDAHVHFYDLDFFPEEDVLDLMRDGPPTVGMDVFQEYIGQITPGRDTDGLCFPYPRAGTDFEAVHPFLAEEVARRPGSRGQMLIKPSLDPEYIRETVKTHGFVGLKCYQLFSPRQPTHDSYIEEFLPEEHVRVAHEQGLTITLHIVRKRGLTDPANQATIRRYAESYPDMKLILAHAGRGFNPYLTIEGVQALIGLENVYFDTGVVQEAGGFEAIVEAMGHTRLLWGSDFPVSQGRGRCVAVGNGTLWIKPEMFKNDKGDTDNTPVMQGYESLRALKLAAMRLKLTDSQVEDLFYGNATALYGL